MSNTLKIYISVLALLFIGAIVIEFNKPKPVDWKQTFNENHKIPYGTYILYNELPELFNGNTIEKIKTTPYQYFDDQFNWEDSSYSVKGSYMLIDVSPNLDAVSAQELLDFASHGNDLFISTSYPPSRLLDSLNISIQRDYSLSGKASLSLANTKFATDSITIQKGLSNNYFSELDSVTTTVLGYQKFDTKEHINFIKVDYFNGNIYLHLQPTAFSNYHLLKKDNKKYAAAALSYLPDNTIFYDSRSKSAKELGESPLRYLLKQPALKWAWYLGLLSLLLFMIFNAKRKQRVVEIIKPLTNTTVDFTKTIGNLYYETKDHNNLVDKKITYFLEHIRRRYYLNTQLLDDKFILNLSLKSGSDKKETKKLIELVANLRAKQICTEADLLALNKAIEAFYTK